ncbi:PH domain-containing protein [Aquipuribacter hungaricus]|uniref:PH domain-containing protein n=1 Tax=Aquipuribacter hungaricus TaxID=545624 RepID=A0ABV7WJX3_9MICO
MTSQVYRPGAVRVLAVAWWLLSAVLAGDLLLRGAPDLGSLVGLSVLLLGCAIVHAMFWQPEVRVDDDGVDLVNVLRRVRLPWPVVEDVDTRWALSIGAGGRRWTSWAAPASGRRVRPVSRRETPWVEPGATSIAGSRAPGSSAGEAAVLVGSGWQRWKDRPGARDAGRAAVTGATGPAGPVVSWNVPVVAALGVTGALVAAGALALALL